MDKQIFERWEAAEREARAAALELLAALDEPGRVPRDRLFEHLFERRREALLALEDCMTLLSQATANTCRK